MTSASPEEHWFTGRDLEVMLFKINRRPLPANLFSDATGVSQPQDALAHVQRNLLSPVSRARSGRRFQRIWQVGNLTGDTASELTGRVGWQRSGDTLATVYDETTRSWVDRQVSDDVSAVAPFALIADGRILGVLKHSTFADKTVAEVFTALLNSAENAQDEPTTNFEVEPVGDTQQFFDWLSTVDSVTRVEFVFHRPNPDVEAGFQELFTRLEDYRAGEIREVIKAQDNNQGLDQGAFSRDGVAQSFLAAVRAAYGYVKASGRRKGRRTHFDQRRRSAREAIADVGPSWEAATEEVVQATRRGRGRQTQGG